jgi:hypothetical protein
MSSLQAFKLLLGGVGHGWESLAHGVDVAGMSAGRLRTSKCGETARPSSIGLQLWDLEGFALHELWLEPVDGVWETQGPEKRRFLPAHQHPQTGLDLAMRQRSGPLGLAFWWLSVGARSTIILTGIVRVTKVTWSEMDLSLLGGPDGGAEVTGWSSVLWLTVVMSSLVTGWRISVFFRVSEFAVLLWGCRDFLLKGVTLAVTSRVGKRW